MGADLRIAQFAAVHEALTDDSSNRLEEHHDFGLVIASDQVLTHAFVLRNAAAAPIRILSGEATMPCCTTIRVEPRVVPPGGEERIPIEFRPALPEGERRMEFRVATESHPKAGKSIRTFVARARVVAEWEIRGLELGRVVLPAGEGTRLDCTLACRSDGRVGIAIPERVSGRPPVTAEFVGEAQTRSLAAGRVVA